jgi:integrase
MGGNGRIRPNFVLVDGKPREYTEGHYQLRFYEGAKPVYRSVGNNAQDALLEKDKQAQLLIARDAAVASGTVLVEEAGRISLSKYADKFVQAAHDRDAHVVAKAYRLAVDEFLSGTGRTYADQITADDIAGHHKALRKTRSARTVHNRNVLVKAFLTYCGVPKMIKDKKPPKFDKTLPEIYEAEELKAFFAFLSDPYHKLIFRVLLMTGLREQEAMYLEWPDISHSNKTLTIHSKPNLGFRIKDKEERSVPIPNELLKMLNTYQKTNPKKRFVLGNVKDRPNTHLLRLLKSLVRKAGLNCGHCEGCKDREECERWFLHKFRATCCTQWLRSGLDLRTVQQMMGHSDIESTMRYLRPQEDTHTQAKINSIKWTN